MKFLKFNLTLTVDGPEDPELNEEKVLDLFDEWLKSIPNEINKKAKLFDKFVITELFVEESE